MDCWWRLWQVSDTKINSLKNELDNDDNIEDDQYTESKNEFKIDLIGIDNIEHVRDIIAVNEYLFHETTMSMNKYDYLKFDDNYHSN